jgi:hypothetical protein
MQDLVRNGVVAGFAVTASALRHVGWWLDWHTRARPSGAGKSLEDVSADAPDAQRAA